MSPISFDDFNKGCSIITLEERSVPHIIDPYRRYSNCIEDISNRFKYPPYYTGLIALVLLFSNDASYDLFERSRIEKIFQESKMLAMMGCKEFEGFNINSLGNLISNLREMSDIFKSQYVSYQSASNILPSEFKMEECFKTNNGIKIQIKPIDFSKSGSDKHIMDLDTRISVLGETNCDEYINHGFTRYAKAYGSVVSGFILTTVVGNILYYE